MGYFNREKLWSIAKRFGGGRPTSDRMNRCLKLAYRGVFEALTKMNITRYQRKRDYRTLWIQRIDAAAQEHGMQYKHLIHALKVENVKLDRKILADLAVNEPFTFKAIVDSMKLRMEKSG